MREKKLWEFRQCILRGLEIAREFHFFHHSEQCDLIVEQIEQKFTVTRRKKDLPPTTGISGKLSPT